MQLIKGDYFNGKSSASQSASLELGDGGIMGLILADQPTRELSIKQSNVMPPIGNTAMKICFGDGEQFVTDEQQILKSYMASCGVGVVDRTIHMLENRWGMVIASLLFTVVVVYSTYIYGIPMATRTITNLIPTTNDRQIGENLLQLFDKTTIFAETEISEKKQQHFHKLFNNTISKLPQRQGLQYQLKIHHSDLLGANAIAIPSGTIIVTDGFLRLVEDNREFKGVIAHEVGHIYYRHGVRSTIQKSLLSFALIILVGDTSNILEDITQSIPILLTQTGYSRKFEQEADRFALEYMRKEQISGSHFANILSRLTNRNKQKKQNESKEMIESYLSTHPATKERIKLFIDVKN
ncbi:MAG: M48 family metallopeptidase [Magnetococcales bacterium]|nr:M48 family metallopeptidase [Magnetococcales bacterium]